MPNQVTFKFEPLITHITINMTSLKCELFGAGQGFASLETSSHNDHTGMASLQYVFYCV